MMFRICLLAALALLWTSSAYAACAGGQSAVLNIAKQTIAGAADSKVVYLTFDSSWSAVASVNYTVTSVTTDSSYASNEFSASATTNTDQPCVASSFSATTSVDLIQKKNTLTVSYNGAGCTDNGATARSGSVKLITLMLSSLAFVLGGSMWMESERRHVLTLLIVGVLSMASVAFALSTPTCVEASFSFVFGPNGFNTVVWGTTAAECAGTQCNDLFPSLNSNVGSLLNNYLAPGSITALPSKQGSSSRKRSDFSTDYELYANRIGQFHEALGPVNTVNLILCVVSGLGWSLPATGDAGLRFLNRGPIRSNFNLAECFPQALPPGFRLESPWLYNVSTQEFFSDVTGSNHDLINIDLWAKFPGTFTEFLTCNLKVFPRFAVFGTNDIPADKYKVEFSFISRNNSASGTVIGRGVLNTVEDAIDDIDLLFYEWKDEGYDPDDNCMNPEVISTALIKLQNASKVAGGDAQEGFIRSTNTILRNTTCPDPDTEERDTTSFALNFNDDYLSANNLLNGDISCWDRNDVNTIVYIYRIYTASDGAAVSLNFGAPFTSASGDGYTGYYGTSFDGNAPSGPTTVTTINFLNFQEVQKNYTVEPTNLKVRDSNAFYRPLNTLDENVYMYRFAGFAGSALQGSIPQDASVTVCSAIGDTPPCAATESRNSQFRRVSYNKNTGVWTEDAILDFSGNSGECGTGFPIYYLATPVTYTNADIAAQYIDFGGFNFTVPIILLYSFQLGFAMYSASQTAIQFNYEDPIQRDFWTEEYTPIYCTEDCPRKNLSDYDLTNLQKSDIFISASNQSDPLVYYFNRTSWTLHAEDGTLITATKPNSGEFAEQVELGRFGYSTSALVSDGWFSIPSDFLNIKIPFKDDEKDWLVTDQSNGNSVDFAKPLQFSYTHSAANDYDGNTEFAGQEFFLQYNGFGIYGFPNKEVKPYGPNGPTECWPEVSLANNVTLTEITGGIVYRVLPVYGRQSVTKLNSQTACQSSGVDSSLSNVIGANGISYSDQLPSSPTAVPLPDNDGSFPDFDAYPLCVQDGQLIQTTAECGGAI